MSRSGPISSGQRGTLLAAAVARQDWEQVAWSLAVALARLLEQLPADAAPQLLALLEGEDDATEA